MNFNDCKEAAKQKMTLCKACKVCNGLVCAGISPGPGGKGDGSSFIENVVALKKVKLVMDAMHPDYSVDTKIDLFNYTFDVPFFIAPMAAIETHFGTAMDAFEFNDIIISGAREFNSIAFLGDGVKDEYFAGPIKALDKYPANGIITIKPWSDEIVYKKFDQALAKKPLAIAMDIDASGLIHLKNTATPITFKDVKSLKAYKKYLNVPFIIKGIMSVEGARKALEVGADAIVVSNHGGRVLNNTVPSIIVLQEIATFVNGRMKILFDGGVRNGSDIFKAIALGADGVLIGRPFAVGAIGGKVDGVVGLFKQLENELKEVMMMCDCKNLHEINADKVKILS